MRDMLEQYRGSVSAYDEGLVAGDAVLAAAIWRNIFGAGWGGVGGVKGKRAPRAGEVPELGPNPNKDAVMPLAVDPIQRKVLKKDQKGEDVFLTDKPIVDPTRNHSNTPLLFPDDPDLEFAQTLEKLVVYIRKEVQRLERLPEDVVVHGRPPKGKGSLVDFTQI